MTDHQHERRSYDGNIARMEQKMDDVFFSMAQWKANNDKRVEASEKRVEELEIASKLLNGRLDSILHKPMEFAAWSMGAILLAVFSAIGFKVYQLVGHLLDAIKKAW